MPPFYRTIGLYIVEYFSRRWVIQMHAAAVGAAARIQPHRTAAALPDQTAE
jgi:hypothetical protein